MAKLGTVSRRKLLRVLPHRADVSVRPTLGGVCCRPGGCIVATSGHTLAMMKEAHDLTEQIVFLFSAANVANLEKWNAVSDELFVYGATPNQGYATLIAASGDAIAVPTDTEYPDVDTVIPSGMKPEPLTSIAVKMTLGRYFPEYATLRFYGEAKVIEVRDHHDPDFLGLWMPMRGGELQEAPLTAWKKPS